MGMRLLHAMYTYGPEVHRNISLCTPCMLKQPHYKNVHSPAGWLISAENEEDLKNQRLICNS